jgi:voltage-gated potassium channel
VEDLRRQLSYAFIALGVILPVGILGFMTIEGLSFIDSLWLTFITLATVGYGDVYARTEIGRLFTIALLVVGLSVLASALQASFTMLVNPEIRALRQRRRILKTINAMREHYIICGKGEMVDKTVGYLLAGAEARRQAARERAYQPIDYFLDRVFGDDADGHNVRLRRLLRTVILFVVDLFHTDQTILDIVVVVTSDKDYAAHLRSAGLLVIEADPTDDNALKQAGIDHARGLMVILDNDTETLLCVLTAHNLNRVLPITAAVLDEELGRKTARVGATNIITPYEVTGQFLNNATFRPAVNEYFNGLVFDYGAGYGLTSLNLYNDSPWLGKSIKQLQLRKDFSAGLIGIRPEDGLYHYAPLEDYILQEDDVLIAVAPRNRIRDLIQACRGDNNEKRHIPVFQAIPLKIAAPVGRQPLTLSDAEAMIPSLAGHFIICGDDAVARSAIDKLDPERAFVIICQDETLTAELLQRGFRVIQGNPTQENTLMKAGVRKAQGIAISLENKADSVMTVLTARTLNKRILITGTAHSDDMVEKLERAGADRVVSPFHLAARFIILAATRPEVNDFIAYVLYNYQTRLETTELYMENEARWIGKSIAALRLHAEFNAGIIGIRKADKLTYVYAPPQDYVIQPNEVLIVVTPMDKSDELRDAAHGSGKRPATLRKATSVMQSDMWTRDILQELINQRSQGQD